ncbi:Adenosylcobinamide-GDP ribazoletransferase [Tepidimonas thermarum]|uniref:Adenosylcobinamide-GDP ribazoletransferase n=1 Tax=Tepidimonas thermarum TaxID=335431 RepID=A0A554WX86_9BURK|nr:adenosylcobinamide-GDP ribazoletransferase [Tepidimonas thermarum]TSE28189.1 Adenosylcobinamide-GDP ribazoletransferase [Tepidimonas thermarum]
MLARAVRHWLLALQFFTRIPVTGRIAAWVGYTPAMLRASAAHFPGVGWVVGGCSAVVGAGALAVLPAQTLSAVLAGVLATVASVWLTGAFHEDGLADTADALGGLVPRERALEIMKDSRIGSYGTAALVLALLTKVAMLALLAGQGGAMLAAALLGGHVTSRWTPLWIIRTLSHVGDAPHAKSKPLADAISAGALAVGTLWWLAAIALCAVWVPSASWLGGVLGAVLALGWMRRLLARRLQGFTGDTLGATQQLSELGFYLGLLMVPGLAAHAGG